MHNAGYNSAWVLSYTEIIVQNDGSNQQRLDYGRFPTWTNDSKYIIYCNADDDFFRRSTIYN